MFKCKFLVITFNCYSSAHDQCMSIPKCVIKYNCKADSDCNKTVIIYQNIKIISSLLIACRTLRWNAISKANDGMEKFSVCWYERVSAKANYVIGSGNNYQHGSELSIGINITLCFAVICFYRYNHLTRQLAVHHGELVSHVLSSETILTSSSVYQSYCYSNRISNRLKQQCPKISWAWYPVEH